MCQETFELIIGVANLICSITVETWISDVYWKLQSESLHKGGKKATFKAGGSLQIESIHALLPTHPFTFPYALSLFNFFCRAPPTSRSKNIVSIATIASIALWLPVDTVSVAGACLIQTKTSNTPSTRPHRHWDECRSAYHRFRICAESGSTSWTNSEWDRCFSFDVVLLLLACW